ncbi:MAG: glycosyltransferase family 2 protein [archaeon]
MNRLSVIIPVYNEQDNVRLLHRQLIHALKNISSEIIFVNDGSTDKTLDVLRSIEGLTVVGFQRNRGLSKALQCGFSRATGDIIITMDGDLQNDPEDIPRLLKKLLSGYDAVCGRRMPRDDSFIAKRIPSMIFNYFLRLRFNVPVHDCSCTFRAYRPESVKDLKLSDGMHRFIPLILHKTGHRISEIPVAHKRRMHGKAKFNSPIRFCHAVRDIVRFSIE